jgi:hypothetical protein
MYEKCTCGCVGEKAGDGEDGEERGEKAVGVRVSLVPHGSAGLESPLGCDPPPYMGSAGARVHPRTPEKRASLRALPLPHAPFCVCVKTQAAIPPQRRHSLAFFNISSLHDGGPSYRSGICFN